MGADIANTVRHQEKREFNLIQRLCLASKVSPKGIELFEKNPTKMASTQPSPSQPMVVSTQSGTNRVMPTPASASGAPVAPTPSGSSAMGANPAPAAVALSMSLTPTSQTNQDLASLFECPVCFDYVLPPILQCHAGHLVCSSCRPKLTCCPTCRGQLGGNIRNLAMEKVDSPYCTPRKQTTKKRANLGLILAHVRVPAVNGKDRWSKSCRISCKSTSPSQLYKERT